MLPHRHTSKEVVVVVVNRTAAAAAAADFHSSPMRLVTLIFHAVYINYDYYYVYSFSFEGSH